MNGIPPANLASIYNNNVIRDRSSPIPQISLAQQSENQNLPEDLKIDRSKFIEAGKVLLDKVIKFVTQHKDFPEGLINMVLGDGQNELNELFDYLNKRFQEESPDKLSFKNIKNFISELQNKVLGLLISHFVNQ